MILMTLCTRLSKVKGFTRSFVAQHILIFKPDTILRWHRELVRRKWVYDNQTKHGGHPPLDEEIQALIVQLAHETNWGIGKIQGELQKLGYRVGKTTILNVLKQNNLPPQPERRDRNKADPYQWFHD